MQPAAVSACQLCRSCQRCRNADGIEQYAVGIFDRLLQLLLLLFGGQGFERFEWVAFMDGLVADLYVVGQSDTRLKLRHIPLMRASGGSRTRNRHAFIRVSIGSTWTADHHVTALRARIESALTTP